MESKRVKVPSVAVKIVTDKPVKKTPYQVKGVIMRQFPDEEIVPMLDGRYREKFLYPRVQVKILNEQIYLLGLNEGVAPIMSLIDKFDFLDFGNITFQVLGADVDKNDNRFQPTNRLIRYRFITPWVALNQITGSRYRFLNNAERAVFLNRLLGQNIVFLAREMGMEIQKKVYTKTSLTSLFPKPVDEHNWGAFTGEFRTNFVLPNYIGVGNGITRGYGTIYGLFNPDMFHFDEGNLSEEAVDDSGIEEISENDTELEEVSVDDVPTPRKRRPASKKKGRKVLSEEFDIEEEEDTSDEDAKFNRPEYHSKQHDF
ncbi:MAG: CRISPR-associated endonuclease Cas6 [Fidelibacterota bacterium]